ncbi:MAG: oligosaccharide flippase family protein [Geobacteraceae bacterium]|nr:oligosaccharide flippase family protein [Geobacteraceae bacterium]
MALSESLKPVLDRFWNLRQEMTWILFGQFLGFIGGFIGIKFLTNLMGPHGYGQLALGLTIAGLFNTYVYGPVANVVIRFFSVYRERGQLGSYFSILRKSHRLMAVGGISLALVASGATGYFLGSEWALIILLSCLYGVTSGINVSFNSLQNAIRQRKIVALHQGADVWLRIGLSIALLLLFSKSGYFALLGYLSGTLLVTISQRIFALKNETIRKNWHLPATDPLLEKESFQEFSSYATSFMIFAVFASFSLYADRWILQGMFGSSAVGLYAAIFQIAASPVSIFFTMVSQLMVPIVFERAGSMTKVSQVESSGKLLNQTILVSSFVAIVITLALYLFSEPLVRIITNATFAKQHNLLWIIAMGLCFFNLGQQLTIKGLSFNRPRIYLWPKILQAVSLLMMAYFLALHFEIIGVAWAVCLSSLIYLVAVVSVNKKLCEKIP